MSVTKTTITEAPEDAPTAQAGQMVTIEYTGWVKDVTMEDNKGKRFDSSTDEGRSDFVVQIGKGFVIKGWDEGVTQMKVGERAMLDITSNYAYKDKGFSNLIPPNSDLLFEVFLKKAEWPSPKPTEA